MNCICVAVLGLLIGIIVHSAAIQDRDGAKLLLLRVKGRFLTMEKQNQKVA